MKLGVWDAIVKIVAAFIGKDHPRLAFAALVVMMLGLLALVAILTSTGASLASAAVHSKPIVKLVGAVF